MIVFVVDHQSGTDNCRVGCGVSARSHGWIVSVDGVIGW